MNTLKNILFTTLPITVILLIILELFFRFIIPASDPPQWIINEDEKMIFFNTEKKEGVSTIGKFAEIRCKWRINNMNWNYPIDYYPVKDKKLIAIIGDSYIEALSVIVDESYPFVLREKLISNYEVYAFGISGAPLSQCLNISRYVKKHFNPDIFIINLVHNDFDESIQEIKPTINYFLQVSVNTDGSVRETMPPPKYSSQQYKPWKKLIYKSALFRYLFLNLRIKELRDQILKRSNGSYEANINPNEVRKNQELISKTTDYLVKTFREENDGKRIIFIIDAPRGNIYNNTINSSNVLWMNEMLDTICARNNVEYIDLTPYMYQDYIINNRKFNSEIDGHWNEYGHKFVANVLYEYLKDN